MSGDDALPEALAGVLAYWYPDAGTGQAHTPEEHLRAADAVLALPEVAALRAKAAAADRVEDLCNDVIDDAEDEVPWVDHVRAALDGPRC